MKNKLSNKKLSSYIKRGIWIVIIILCVVAFVKSRTTTNDADIEEIVCGCSFVEYAENQFQVHGLSVDFIADVEYDYKIGNGDENAIYNDCAEQYYNDDENEHCSIEFIIGDKSIKVNMYETKDYKDEIIEIVGYDIAFEDKNGYVRYVDKNDSGRSVYISEMYIEITGSDGLNIDDYIEYYKSPSTGCDCGCGG